MLQDLILRTKLRGTGFITQQCWVIHFRLTKMVRRKCFVPVTYQLLKGKSRGRPLNFFTWFIGAGGCRWLIEFVTCPCILSSWSLYDIKFVAFIYYRFLLWSRPDLERLLCVILMRYTHTHIHTHTATHCNTLPHAQTHTATHMQTHMQTQSCCV